MESLYLCSVKIATRTLHDERCIRGAWERVSRYCSLTYWNNIFTIYLNKYTMANNSIGTIPAVQDDARISSLEIAEMAGKQHKNVMRDIREMEEAWMKVNGLSFELVDYIDKKGECRPCYSLSKLESLYVITKYSNEARAKLVLRWYELEREVRAISEAKADYYDEVMESIDSFTVRSIAAQLKMTAQELNKLLCEEHVQYGQSGSYLPYAEYARRGFCKSRTYKRHGASGEIRTEHRTTWTEPGISFIVDKVNEVKTRRLAMLRPRAVQLTLFY